MTLQLQQIQELGAPEQERTQLGKLYSFKDEKARYRKNYLVWDAIERANLAKLCREKAKYLSKDAQAIVAIVIQKLEKGERVFLNHRYISSITKCKRRQNLNIIKQLAAVFDIKYHNSITYNDKKYRHSYEFLHKQQEQENISPVEHFAEDSVGQFIARQTAPLHIIKNKDIEDIDLGSNFLKNSESENREETSTAKIINFPTRIKKRLPNQRKKTTNSKTKTKVIRFNQYPRPKTLAEHYPLNQEDWARLQSKSSREFSLNAMNEILLDMSKRLERQFKSKARFIAYFGKCLMYEMRDAVKTANENFRIKSNITEEERNYGERERLLTAEECNDSGSELENRTTDGFQRLSMLGIFDKLIN